MGHVECCVAAARLYQEGTSAARGWWSGSDGPRWRKHVCKRRLPGCCDAVVSWMVLLLLALLHQWVWQAGGARCLHPLPLPARGTCLATGHGGNCSCERNTTCQLAATACSPSRAAIASQLARAGANHSLGWSTEAARRLWDWLRTKCWLACAGLPESPLHAFVGPVSVTLWCGCTNQKLGGGSLGA
jgi:hypothetical protein